jgi:hypothetical protein
MPVLAKDDRAAIRADDVGVPTQALRCAQHVVTAATADDLDLLRRLKGVVVGHSFGSCRDHDQVVLTYRGNLLLLAWNYSMIAEFQHRCNPGGCK